MFNFDCRSVTVNAVTISITLLIIFCGILLTGCAVSGCGNPISHNNVDSNDYINEQNSVIINAPSHKLREQLNREKITGKYKKNI